VERRRRPEQNTCCCGLISEVTDFQSWWIDTCPCVAVSQSASPKYLLMSVIFHKLLDVLKNMSAQEDASGRLSYRKDLRLEVRGHSGVEERDALSRDIHMHQNPVLVLSWTMLLLGKQAYLRAKRQ
jgi:hypothetical protein